MQKATGARCGGLGQWRSRPFCDRECTPCVGSPSLAQIRSRDDTNSSSLQYSPGLSAGGPRLSRPPHGPATFAVHCHNPWNPCDWRMRSLRSESRFMLIPRWARWRNGMFGDAEPAWRSSLVATETAPGLWIGTPVGVPAVRRFLAYELQS